MAKQNSNKANVRSDYQAPKLTVYGSFSELTASGSGANVESNNGQGQPNRRP